MHEVASHRHIGTCVHMYACVCPSCLFAVLRVSLPMWGGRRICLYAFPSARMYVLMRGNLCPDVSVSACVYFPCVPMAHVRLYPFVFFVNIYIYIRYISLPLCLSQNCTKKLDIEKLRCQNLPVGTESFKLLEHTFPAETSSRLNGFLA